MNEKRPETIDQRLVKALAHPLRVQILELLTERVASPNWLLRRTRHRPHPRRVPHPRADRCGCLELVDTARRRGATEHFYKAAPHAFIGSPHWRRVPRAVRGAITAASLQTFMDKAVAALEAGTLDCRDDATLTWMPLRLDDEGWAEVTAIMEEANDRILAVQAGSSARLAATEGEGKTEAISAVVALANFETGGSRGG